MTEALGRAVPRDVGRRSRLPPGMALAWRNLWRNPRRTWLTAGGVAFSVLLLSASLSIQAGSYATMIESGTGLFHGHLQVQRTDYLDDPSLGTTLPEVDVMMTDLERLPDVRAVAPRLAAFALVSVGERSFGAQLIGVDPAREPAVSTLPGMLAAGRFLRGGQEVVLGTGLARNLDAALGDEIVVLGTSPKAGVAAAALTVVGIFDSGLDELDRMLMETPIGTFRDMFGMGDEANGLVFRLSDAGAVTGTAAAVASRLGPDEVVRPWPELLPELEQSIALDRTSSVFLYSILLLLVLFSVINTFVMTVFDRTRELGMLIAMGMRRWRVVRMLMQEAFWMSLVGVVLGGLLVMPVLYWLIDTGIPMGGAAEMLRQYHLPERLYGAFVPALLLAVPLVMMLACQLAAFLPAQRVRRLVPIEAIRAQ